MTTATEIKKIDIPPMKNINRLRHELETDCRSLAEQYFKSNIDPKIKKRMLENYRDFEIAINTVERNLELQIDNAKANIKYQKNNISKYKNIWHDKTALCLAFGPSLRDDEKDLIRIKDKYRIICADRGFYWLMDRGIRPQYVCALDCRIDPKYIGDHDCTGITLMAHIGCNKKYVAKWISQGGDVYFFNTICRLKSHYEIYRAINTDDHIDVVDNVPLFHVSLNVGHGVCAIALDLFNAKRVLLGGYDHAFTKDLYYPDYKTVGLEENIKSEKAILMTDIRSQECYSDAQLINYNHNLYLYLFCRKYIDHEQPERSRVVNCSGGILKIPCCKRFSDY
jgi:hypothetical protein